MEFVLKRKSGGLISHPGPLLIGRPKSEDKHCETGWAEGIHDATMNSHGLNHRNQ